MLNVRNLREGTGVTIVAVREWARGCDQSCAQCCARIGKALYMCGIIDLPETLVTPLNSHFGPALWAASWSPAGAQTRSSVPEIAQVHFSGFPLSDILFDGKKGAIEEASSPWGHGAMAILTLEILDGKRSAGHHNFTDLRYASSKVRDTLF